MERYIFNGSDPAYLDVDQLFAVTVTHPDTDSRKFVAEYSDRTWVPEKKDCLYVGNSQGGEIKEVQDSHFNDPVIQGIYSDYLTTGLYDHAFAYSRFDHERCGSWLVQC